MNRRAVFLYNTNMKKCCHAGVTFFLPPNPPSSKLTQICHRRWGKGLIVKNKEITIALNL